jgi:hypothetical protein
MYTDTILKKHRSLGMYFYYLMTEINQIL